MSFIGPCIHVATGAGDENTDRHFVIRECTFVPEVDCWSVDFWSIVLKMRQ